MRRFAVSLLPDSVSRFLTAAAVSLTVAAAGASADTGGPSTQGADPAPVLSLGLGEARRAALLAVQTGRNDAAIFLANAMIEADRTDSFAHFVLAHAHLRAGRPEDAAAPARRAYRFAKTDVERQEAARAAAMSAAARERYLASQIWLRLAIQAAPNDALKARSVREFRAARQRARLKLSFGLSIMPSSNVNGGSTADVVTVDGQSRTFFGTIPIPRASEALSGTEIRGDLRFRYALNRATRSETSLHGAFDIKRVRFSDEAKDKVPGIDAADYGSGTAELGLAHRFVLGEGAKSPVAFGGLYFGRRWYGEEVDYDFGRIEAGLVLPLTDTRSASLRLTRQVEQDADSPDEHATSSAQIALSQRLGNGDVLSFGVYGGETLGDDPQRRKLARALQLRYARAEPIGPVKVEMGLSATRVHYPDYRVILFAPPDGGRRDEILAANLDLTLHDLDYWGFVPEIRVSARRSTSNISFFESEGVSVSMGFESAF